MAKILLIEDDELLRDALGSYLNGKGHAVVAAPNGKAAKSLAYTSDFQLVISDIKMPHINGIEFLLWMREHSKVPLILMTGFSELMEARKAAELGASAFLTKPFSNRVLMDLVKEFSDPKFAAEEVLLKEKIDAQYEEFAIQDFLKKTQAETDLYVRLASGRYLKVASSGDALGERIGLIYQKGIIELFIRREELAKKAA